MNQGQSDLSKRVANSLIEMPVQESALSRATAAEYETISGLLGVLRRRWAVIADNAALFCDSDDRSQPGRSWIFQCIS